MDGECRGHVVVAEMKQRGQVSCDGLANEWWCPRRSCAVVSKKILCACRRKAGGGGGGWQGLVRVVSAAMGRQSTRDTTRIGEPTHRRRAESGER